MIDNIIILAAGQGKRMQSNLPKVLQPLAGKPLLFHVLDTAKYERPSTIFLILGHLKEMIINQLQDNTLCIIEQEAQLGTGHAVLTLLPKLPKIGHSLILFGDVPLISNQTINQLKRIYTSNQTMTLLTTHMQNPTGFGRIIRHSDGNIIAITEEKDATDEQKRIQEVYTGICIIQNTYLHTFLPQLKNDNAQKEYYLTDLVKQFNQANIPVDGFISTNPMETQGINDKHQLHTLERYYQSTRADALLTQGVTLINKDALTIRGEVTVGKDVTIDTNVTLIGNVILEDGVTIHANTVIENAHLKKNVTIHPFCHLSGAMIGENCEIGPFARLRQGTILDNQCKIGNFVETKKVTFGKGTKVSHLSYLGDAVIGERVNIGAGTITCNYDGVHKYETIIEDDVFIGSDTQLIAPVKVGTGATLGAGTTLTKDAPAGKLTLTERKQKTIDNWVRKKKPS
jgi:bifunctional UDP-N-acetylglucosamine pyrophosphorylase/glucosamine-1-phosphate N-acetyltransferase